MISHSPQFHKSLRLAVRDDTVVVFFTLHKQLKKWNVLLVCN